MIGINDFSSGVSVNEVFGNYKLIVSKLTGKKIEVYIQSTILAGKQKEYLNNDIVALNERLQVLAKQNDLVTYIDLNVGLAPDLLLAQEYSRDGVHLNGDGYAIWKELIKPYLK